MYLKSLIVIIAAAGFALAEPELDGTDEEFGAAEAELAGGALVAAPDDGWLPLPDEPHAASAKVAASTGNADSIRRFIGYRFLPRRGSASLSHAG
ncbi:MAG: hypothetical protein ACRDRN_15465 [Sciscionella sp.]